VRVAAEDLAVLACAGLALVGVNYQVPGSTIALVSRHVKNCRGKKPTFDGSLEEDISFRFELDSKLEALATSGDHGLHRRVCRPCGTIRVIHM
jgi:hypothetical protein